MNYLLVSLSLLGACGGNGTFDPGSGDDPGGGTQTLVVDGSATARPRVPNATQPADFDTEFSVRVTLNAQPVTTGTVVMTSAAGEVSLVFRPDNNGSWEGIGAGYEEVYQLDVTSGADSVEGVRVDGPDIHTFSDPLAGAVVDSTLAMPLSWDRSDAADAAVLRAGDGDGITITDTGDYVVAPATLKSKQDQPEPNTIRLTRTNRVAPAGAAPGSELGVSVTNEIQVVAQVNPNA